MLDERDSTSGVARKESHLTQGMDSLGVRRHFTSLISMKKEPKVNTLLLAVKTTRLFWRDWKAQMVASRPTSKMRMDMTRLL